MVFQIAYIFFVCLAGGFITGVTGFGYAMVCMGLLTMILDVKTSTLIVLLSAIVQFIQLLYKLIIKTKVKVHYKMLLYPVISTIAGSTIGVWLLMSLPEILLVVLLSATLILISIYFAFFSGRLSIKANAKNGIIAGGISGILTGLYNMGGPPLVTYFFASTDDKNEYNACLQLTLLAGAVFSLAMHLAAADINLSILGLSVSAIFGVLIGIHLGYKFFEKFSKERLGKIISVVIAVLGVLLIAKNLLLNIK